MTAIRSKEAAREFLASGSGKVGTVFFLTIVAVSIYVLVTYPLDFGVVLWNNPAVWADNPKLAPPAWVNMFTNTRRAEHTVLELKKPDTTLAAPEQVRSTYMFEFNFEADEPPSFTSLTVFNVTYHKAPTAITATLSRPDGKNIEIYSFTVPGPRTGETSPVSRFFETPRRIFLSGEDRVVATASDFLRREYGISMSSSDILSRGVDRILFGTPRSGGAFEVLEGHYVFTVRADMGDASDSIGSVKLVVGGKVYGLMGTDSLGRDLAVGLLFGFPVALFIGLSTSTLATGLGTFLGIQSGYRGGKTDMAIQRGSDVLANVPLLPILIFLTFIVGQKLWMVMLLLVAFGWPGLAITVRSMVLQMRSGQLVEAAVAIGASPKRIMLRHILPQVAPFVFAQLIFFTPAAILTEAALSFLGLGDPSLPTWGQILELGFRSGGVYVGHWWWVLPPGFLVVFTALTFALLALGLEPVVNPRLRRMK